MKPQIVFDQTDTCTWTGAPLNAARTIDPKTSQPVRMRSFRARIEQHGKSYLTVRQARSPNARRYDRFRDFGDAQRSLIRWFERTFTLNCDE